MKKLTENDIKLISAYLDGELSEEETEDIERNISESSELREKYEAMKKIKNITSSSFSTLPESQYFETRVMQKIHSGNSVKFKLKKWAPVIGFSVLTIALMLVLKFNPGIFDRLVQTPKTKISGFYKQNLRPLLYAANLTNEDIFNFAFYKQLPLNKSTNQFIRLGTDSGGNKYFEIKKEDNVPQTGNLEKFITALRLNQHQKGQVDSIISAYSEELQSQVLVNDNNTVAINPNLWNYNKALAADLLAFASETKSREFTKIIPAGYKVIDPAIVGRAVNEVKANNNDEYIFITPDTIFSERYNFDKDKFKKEMLELKKNLEKMKKQMKQYNFDFKFKADSNYLKFKNDSAWVKNFQIILDSNLYRFKMPKGRLLPPQLPDFDSIFTSMHLDKLSEQLKDMTFQIPKGFPQKGGEFNFRFKDGDSLKTFKFKMNAVNIDSILKASAKLLDSLHIVLPKNINFDSLSMRNFNYYFNDSLRHRDNKEYKKQMDVLKKEMEKLKEELKKYKKEYKQRKNYQLPDTIKS